MLPRLTALLFLLLPSISAGANNCPDDIHLERALFTNAIQGREPQYRLTQIPAGADALYFFTQVINARGRNIEHVWFYRGEEAARVSLRTGGRDWRTWSSKNLGLRRGPEWAVTVKGPEGCVLGHYSLGNEQAPPGAADDLLKRLHGMLDDNDLPGARLEAKQALEQGVTASQRQVLEQFIHRDLELARAEKEIRQQALYTARSRIEALLAAPLPPNYRERALALHARLNQTHDELYRRANASLADLGATLSATLAGGWPCRQLSERMDEVLKRLLGPEHPFLITGHEALPEGLHFGLLDRRTGAGHEITVRCLHPFYRNPPEPQPEDD